MLECPNCDYIGVETKTIIFDIIASQAISLHDMVLDASGIAGITAASMLKGFGAINSTPLSLSPESLPLRLKKLSSAKKKQIKQIYM